MGCVETACRAFVTLSRRELEHSTRGLVLTEGISRLGFLGKPFRKRALGYLERKYLSLEIYIPVSVL